MSQFACYFVGYVCPEVSSIHWYQVCLQFEVKKVNSLYSIVLIFVKLLFIVRDIGYQKSLTCA